MIGGPHGRFACLTPGEQPHHGPVVPAIRAGSLPGRSRSRREQLRTSIWVVPAVMVVGAFVLQNVLVEIDTSISTDPEIANWFTASIDVAQETSSTIAAAMLTFLGVVFSLSILALQLTSGQFSPRVMRTFLRARSTKLALGTFMATFTFALMTLVSIQTDRGGTDFAPVLTLSVLILLVLASLFVFLAFVRTMVRMIRVSYVVAEVGQETVAALRAPRRFVEARAPTLVVEPYVIRHEGRSGVLGGVDVQSLVRIAARHHVVVEVLVRFGDFVATGTPVLAVHGQDPMSGLPTARLQRGLLVHVERTMFLDPAFGIRQLVDIAVRALSPAVNDPTTAVQVIDQLTEILQVGGTVGPGPGTGARQEALGPGDGTSPGAVVDRSGVVRLLVKMRSWESLVGLAFTEIRRFGSDSPQVSRRLMAAFDELIKTLPPARQAAIGAQRDKLTRDVRQAESDPDEQDLYLTPDRSGLG